MVPSTDGELYLLVELERAHGAALLGQDAMPYADVWIIVSTVVTTGISKNRQSKPVPMRFQSNDGSCKKLARFLKSRVTSRNGR
eukprot:SAG31_NODE_4509_length_3178_cov_13.049367_2_plen_84_part_00